MKHAWQIWLTYLLCLVVIASGMSWLTIKVRELDAAQVQSRRELEQARAEAEAARRAAERQELTGKALWRMDWILTPLVAQEAAHPSYLYESVLVRGEGKGITTKVPSPLLAQPSRFVLLHFQMDENGRLTSPGTPVGPQREYALTCGINPQQLDDNQDRLGLLAACVDRTTLISRLPDQLLPEQGPNLETWSFPNYDLSQVPQESIAIENGYSTNARMAQQAALLPNQAGRPAQQRGQVQFDVEGQHEQAQQQNEQVLAEEAESQSPDGNRHRGVVDDPNSPPPPQIRIFGQQSLEPQESYFHLPTEQESEAINQLLKDELDWFRRNSNLQSFAQTQLLQNRANTMLWLDSPSLAKEGISRPFWVDDNLIMARRILRDDQVWIQGVWFNWDRIKAALLQEVADLLPQAQLIPVRDYSTADPGTTLASLPVALVVSAPATAATSAPGPEWTAIGVSLWVAWGCLSLAAVAVAILLQGVIKLSERRAAFVSAVTHELRTPLTTFRMYAEMLAEGMVPDIQEQRHYTNTLRVEADRLSHLVENVLQYARLERGRATARRERVTVGDLYRRCINRLSERAQQAHMKLVAELDDVTSRRTLHTDPGAVEQILFNLVDNACKYAASADDRRVHLFWTVSDHCLDVRVSDHGPGIEPSRSRRLFQPFRKTVDEAACTAPGVGLGLALCRRLARQLGGQLAWQREQRPGATFCLTLPLAP